MEYGNISEESKYLWGLKGRTSHPVCSLGKTCKSQSYGVDVGEQKDRDLSAPQREDTQSHPRAVCNLVLCRWD